MMGSEHRAFVDSLFHNTLSSAERPLGGAISSDLSSSQCLSPGYFFHKDPPNSCVDNIYPCLFGQEQSDILSHWDCRRKRQDNLEEDGSLANLISNKPKRAALPAMTSPDLGPSKHMHSFGEKFAPTSMETSRGTTNVSQETKCSPGLAIPKPVYGYSTCCVDHGSPSVPSYNIAYARLHQSSYYQDWMQQNSFLQRKEYEALLEEHNTGIRFSSGTHLSNESHTKECQIARPSVPFVEPEYSSFRSASPADSVLEQLDSFQFCKKYCELPLSYDPCHSSTPSPSPHALCHYSPEMSVLLDGGSYADAGRKLTQDLPDSKLRQHSPQQHPATQSMCDSGLHSISLSQRRGHSHHPRHQMQGGQKRTFPSGLDANFQLSKQPAESPNGVLLTTPHGPCDEYFSQTEFHHLPNSSHILSYDDRTKIDKSSSTLRYMGVHCNNNPNDTKEIKSPLLARKIQNDSVDIGEHNEPEQSSLSPPMPVINSVFSLAPYRAYFETTPNMPSPHVFGSCDYTSEIQSHEEKGDLKEHVNCSFHIQTEALLPITIKSEEESKAPTCGLNIVLVKKEVDSTDLQEHVCLPARPDVVDDGKNPSKCQLVIQKISKSGRKSCSKSASSQYPNTATLETADHFMELHEKLCNLISKVVPSFSEEELRAWVSKTGPSGSDSCHSEPWEKNLCLQNEEFYMHKRQVLLQLESYVSTFRCPFPHVIRAGTLYIPMLVVKEILFPKVPGMYIDKVLQQRRVELRPTTLSEEQYLTQLQGHAWSSKLRRLLSLKRLVDVYSDVLNILCHQTASAYLESLIIVKKEEQEFASFPLSDKLTAETEDPPKHPTGAVSLKQHKPKRKGSDPDRRFITDKMLPESSESWSIVSSFTEDMDEPRSTCEEHLDTIRVKLEDSYLDNISSECPQEIWGPVESDDLIPENQVNIFEAVQDSSSEATMPPASSKRRSGMILKLKKVLFKDIPSARGEEYQSVCKVRTPDQVRALGTNSYVEDEHRPTSRRKRLKECHNPLKKKRRKSTSPSSKELSSCKISKSLHLRTSLVKIKYCSYVSSTPTSQRRRKWMLRSAAKSHTHSAKSHYPDLVGKRIFHLYEEKDKSEVWYKGQVVRVHEPHPDPLKTVYEVKYDSEPEWQYYLELLVDYKRGWLRVDD